MTEDSSLPAGQLDEDLHLPASAPDNERPAPDAEAAWWNWVQQMDTLVSVVAEIGKGASVTVALPAMPSAPVPAACEPAVQMARIRMAESVAILESARHRLAARIAQASAWAEPQAARDLDVL